MYQIAYIFTSAMLQFDQQIWLFSQMMQRIFIAGGTGKVESLEVNECECMV